MKKAMCLMIFLLFGLPACQATQRAPPPTSSLGTQLPGLTPYTGATQAPIKVPTNHPTLTLSLPTGIPSSPAPLISLTPTQAISPTIQDSLKLQIVQLRMFDMNIGWALQRVYGPSSQEIKILQTAGGISSWKDVTPTLPNGHLFPPVVSFVEQKTAVVVIAVTDPAVPSNNVVISGLRTIDGGQNWKAGEKLQVESVYPTQLVMFNADYGLMMATRQPGGEGLVVIYNTQDGGVHWKLIYDSNKPFQANSPDALWSTPDYRYKDGKFTFVNQESGFFVDGHDLFTTVDNGKSWKKQIPLPQPSDIPDPKNWNQYFSWISPPQFPTMKDGVLILRAYSSQQIQVKPFRYHGLPQVQSLYYSHDGGQTWTPQSSPAKIGTIYFQTDQTGWFLGKNDTDPSSVTQLYQTMDGGQNWTQISSNCPLPLGSEIQFVDDQVGFAYIPSWAGSYAEIDSRSANSQYLFVTKDGGQSWEKIEPQIEGTHGH